MTLPTIPDNGTEADTLQILRELNRAKVSFQLQSIGTVLGAPCTPSDEQDWRRGVCARLAGEATDSPALKPADSSFHYPIIAE